MKMQILSAAMFVLLGFSVTSAQTSASEKTISSGVLNGKASSLAKPSFPAAARAVRAGGAVNVQVLIDEEGNVVSASAISGHPLLRQASEQAARASKFAPTLLSGQPVKVTGIVVYNYVLPMSFVQIGYELALAEKSHALPDDFPAYTMAANLPKDWSEEKTQALQLNSYLGVKKYKRETAKSATAVDLSVKEASSGGASNSGVYKGTMPTILSKGIAADSGVVTTRGAAGGVVVEGLINFETFNPTDAVKELQSKIETRLSSDGQKLWIFNFGRALGSIAAEVDDTEKTRTSIAEFSRVIAVAPPNVSKSVMARAREIIEYFEQGNFDTERKARLSAMVKGMRYL
jgi:TonB family protein